VNSEGKVTQSLNPLVPSTIMYTSAKNPFTNISLNLNFFKPAPLNKQAESDNQPTPGFQ
jgi:hypothetical protein